MPDYAAARTLTPNQQKRRERILNTARTLVARHGYDGTLMRDVATLAKVSPTTLYNLYNTKDELLLAAVRDSVAEADDKTAEETSKLGYERLVVHLHHSVQQAREEPAYAKAINHALLRASQGDPIVEILIGGTRQTISQSLQAMLEQKNLRPNTDIEALATAMVAAFWGNYMLWSKGELALDNLETELKRGFLALLLPVAAGSTKIDITRQLHALLSC